MGSVKAIYRPALRPEHRGNPFVEALIPRIDDGKIIQRLKKKVTFDLVEKTDDATLRAASVDRLDHLVIPLPEYIESFRMVETCLIESYACRNPLSPTTNHYLHYLNPNDTVEAPDSGRPKTVAKAGTIIGVTGVGKSRMLERIFDYIPQVIEHTEYRNERLKVRQVVWLKVTCLDNMSVRGLCHSILAQIDEALGRGDTKPARTIDALLTQIERQLRVNFVGLVAIDEMQELEAGVGVSVGRVTAFLLNLIDRSGVPLVFCGNPGLLTVLQRKFRVARRAERAGYIEIDSMDIDTWRMFLKHMWQYQWTNVSSDLPEEIIIGLYELTTGIADFLTKTFKMAQKLVIGTGDERITMDVLREAFPLACPLSGIGLDVRRTGAQHDVKAQFNDLILDSNIDPSLAPTEGNQSEDLKACHVLKEGTVSKGPLGDLNRPLHPEFFKNLVQLRDDPFFMTNINDRDMMQRFCAESPVEELVSAGVLLEDPLVEMGDFEFDTMPMGESI